MKNLSFRHATILVVLLVLLAAGCSSPLSSAEAVVQPVSQAFAAPDTAVVDNAAASNAPVAVESNSEAAAASSLATLSTQEQAFVQLYQKANPAVVHIEVGSGLGSGFVYSSDGYIVTNNHVVAAASNGRILVTLADGSQYPATLIGTDPASDIAVIKINATRLTAAKLADSDALQVGQIVIAIGSPFGLAGTMTTGIISGLDRYYPGSDGFQIPDVIQTDAAINPGNSGGPLLNLSGEVVGVNTAIESPVQGSSGIGYAIPANIVSNVAPQLIESGKVAHPWLGLAGATLTANLAQEAGLSATQKGILVNSVVSGGPAAAAGLLSGDVIVGVDNQTVHVFDDLLGYLVSDTAVGQTINLQVLRGGSVQTIPLILQARPANR